MSLLFQSGIVDRRLNHFSSKGFFLILMYHRIVQADKLIQPGMYVSPGTFENHLNYIKKKFNVVPLSSFALKGGTCFNAETRKPSCALTFDDGWKDFYDFAWPLLEKHQLPATVFLPTKFIDSGENFWTDSYAYLLAHRQTTILEKLSAPEVMTIVEYLDGLHGSYNDKLEIGIEYLKKYQLSTIEKTLDGLSEIWNVDIGRSDRYFLNWAEIAEMQDSGLISFGSHTVNHQILTTLNDGDIKKELSDSRKDLLQKNLLVSSCNSFCYPNGNYTKKIADMVRESGYRLAVTTKSGWNHVDADRFTLKRIGIHEDMTSTTSLFACRVAGII